MKLVGIWLQVSLVVVGAFGVIVLVSWLFTGDVISLFHEREVITHDAGVYGSILAVSLPPRVSHHLVLQAFAWVCVCVQRLLLQAGSARMRGLTAQPFYCAW